MFVVRSVHYSKSISFYFLVGSETSKFLTSYYFLCGASMTFHVTLGSKTPKPKTQRTSVGSVYRLHDPKYVLCLNLARTARAGER